MTTDPETPEVGPDQLTLFETLDTILDHWEHEDDWDAPAYCTCGELTRLCPVRPRNWQSGWSK